MPCDENRLHQQTEQHETGCALACELLLKQKGDRAAKTEEPRPGRKALDFLVRAWVETSYDHIFELCEDDVRQQEKMGGQRVSATVGGAIRTTVTARIYRFERTEWTLRMQLAMS